MNWTLTDLQREEIARLKQEVRGLRNAVEIARVALIHSEPKAANYPEPVERHKIALDKCNQALGYSN